MKIRTGIVGIAAFVIVFGSVSGVQAQSLKHTPRKEPPQISMQRPYYIAFDRKRERGKWHHIASEFRSNAIRAIRFNGDRTFFVVADEIDPSLNGIYELNEEAVTFQLAIDARDHSGWERPRLSNFRRLGRGLPPVVNMNEDYINVFEFNGMYYASFYGHAFQLDPKGNMWVPIERFRDANVFGMYLVDKRAVFLVEYYNRDGSVLEMWKQNERGNASQRSQLSFFQQIVSTQKAPGDRITQVSLPENFFYLAMPYAIRFDDVNKRLYLVGGSNQIYELAMGDSSYELRDITHGTVFERPSDENTYPLLEIVQPYLFFGGTTQDHSFVLYRRRADQADASWEAIEDQGILDDWRTARNANYLYHNRNSDLIHFPGFELGVPIMPLMIRDNDNSLAYKAYDQGSGLWSWMQRELPVFGDRSETCHMDTYGTSFWADGGEYVVVRFSWSGCDQKGVYLIDLPIHP